MQCHTPRSHRTRWFESRWIPPRRLQRNSVCAVRGNAAAAASKADGEATHLSGNASRAHCTRNPANPMNIARIKLPLVALVLLAALCFSSAQDAGVYLIGQLNGGTNKVDHSSTNVYAAFDVSEYSTLDMQFAFKA